MAGYLLLFFSNTIFVAFLQHFWHYDVAKISHTKVWVLGDKAF
jgi:hypothetical protein